MTIFVLATANPHKSDEMRAILTPLGIELLDRPDDVGDIEETEMTLEGNALLKARAVVSSSGRAAIADDTGLFVDALGGQPGVLSARYAGDTATDADNVQKLLGELLNVAVERRTARFRTVIAVAFRDGHSFTVEGVLEGMISMNPRGESGFGYDPVFESHDWPGRTLAELSDEEKNSMSHRFRALRALALELAQRGDSSSGNHP